MPGQDWLGNSWGEENSIQWFSGKESQSEAGAAVERTVAKMSVSGVKEMRGMLSITCLCVSIRLTACCEVELLSDRFRWLSLLAMSSIFNVCTLNVPRILHSHGGWEWSVKGSTQPVLAGVQHLLKQLPFFASFGNRVTFGDLIELFL